MIGVAIPLLAINQLLAIIVIIPVALFIDGYIAYSCSNGTEGVKFALPVLFIAVRATAVLAFPPGYMATASDLSQASYSF